MDGVFELIATVVAEVLSVSDFKKTKVKTWTITVFCLLVEAVLVGMLIWGGQDVFRNGSLTGKFVVGVCIAVFAAGFLISIICQHRKNWKSF